MRTAEAHTVVMPTTTTYPATEKQIAFILRLSDERGIAFDAADAAHLSKSEASAHITDLLNTPKIKATGPVAQDIIADRVYVNARGEFVLTCLSEAGRMYGKVLRYKGGATRGKFSYQAGALSDDRPTRAELDREAMEDSEAIYDEDGEIVGWTYPSPEYLASIEDENEPF